MLNTSQKKTEEKIGTEKVIVHGVNKSFVKKGRRTKILDDISFQLEEGEFISLLGPSGCGKSTLLKIIGGLLLFDNGVVSIDGESAIISRKRIGFMFQKSVLLPWRTVKENLLLPIELAGENREKYEPRVNELLEMVDLVGYEQYYPHELSGGMQQRVSLARVLMNDPDILLLDEPFGALDEFTRENLNFSLLDIARKTNKTVILVTHNIGEAVLMSNRIIVLGINPGHILEDITIDINQPRTDKVMTLPEYTEYIWKIRERLGVIRNE